MKEHPRKHNQNTSSHCSEAALLLPCHVLPRCRNRGEPTRSPPHSILPPNREHSATKASPPSTQLACPAAQPAFSVGVGGLPSPSGDLGRNASHTVQLNDISTEPGEHENCETDSGAPQAHLLSWGWRATRQAGREGASLPRKHSWKTAFAGG